ncbi:hypothetical protein NHP21005_01970 [Helicobacter sp. NHP21005]|uniref:DUF1360 domain-containing protein n=1 Tax=Helicobacter felistomachi TaxID=3040201 RepID=UPI00257310B6|nr:DUF1360 domain-containing protein [Helicobacter sp. NHP21005]BEG56509.1 hypothetical protein NHP21005_01970 [Helicobacter sp. NHP21005]
MGVVQGLEHLDKVIYLDQAPIGKTPRSNLTTYTGVMDDIRELFAQSKDAKMLGYSASRFSFNVRGGGVRSATGRGKLKLKCTFCPMCWCSVAVVRGASTTSRP